MGPPNNMHASLFLDPQGPTHTHQPIRIQPTSSSTTNNDARVLIHVCVPTRLDAEGEGGGLDPVQAEAGGERGEESPTSTTTSTTLGVGLLCRPVCVGWGGKRVGGWDG